jgi:hypothetical protein
VWVGGQTTWDVVGVADFDGDDKGDILWRNSLDDLCHIWLIDETGLVT